MNRIQWMNDTYPLAQTDKILQKTPYVFDVSVWELFWGVWYGATVVFAQPEGHKDMDYLVHLISEEQISIIHFVPSMLEIFSQYLASRIQTLSSLRYLFCSGEALPLTSVQKIHELLPQVALHRMAPLRRQ